MADNNRSKNAGKQNAPVQASRPAGNYDIPSIAVEESRTVPDGQHTGSIAKVVYEKRGEEGFPYVDVHVTESVSGVTIKAGYAASRITPETDLGRLLARFGATVKPGQNADFSVLAGDVEFTTDTERSKNGRFARVQLDSLRPA